MGLFARGGAVVYAILLLSVAAVAVILERAVYLIKTREDTGGLLEEVKKALASGGKEQALEVARSAQTPCGRFIAAGLRGSGREEVRRRLEDAGRREAFLYRRYLSVLSAVAQVAPLLGLLGTVWGFIEAFQRITEAAGGMVDPQALAGGIWKALITTALGLGVAIPSYLAYYILAGLSERRLVQLELAGDALIEALEEEHAHTA